MEIEWPEGYHPDECPLHVRNELEMSVPCDQVWQHLVRAPLWPTWYPNSFRVRLSQAEPDLRMGTRFSWITFLTYIKSEVIVFDAGRETGWAAHGFGCTGYHVWQLQSTDKGCRVVTEETQKGWLVRAVQLILHPVMRFFHQLWLERLEIQARDSQV